MLWQMILHSTSLTIATGVLPRPLSRNFALIIENALSTLLRL
jgi:hypothetical protein